MKKESRYTNGELLEILKNHNNKGGNMNQSYFCNKNGLPHYQTYIKQFGSWNNAKRLIGIPEEQLLERKRCSKQELVSLFTKFVYDSNGRIPTLTEFEEIKGFPSIKIIYKYFKSYNELVEYCGVYSNTASNGKYKKEFLINEIKRFVKEFGRVPISKDFKKLDDYPSRKTFTNHFGNFNDVIRLAGFEPVGMSRRDNKIRYTKDFLLEQINNYIEQNNKTPTLANLTQYLGYEPTIYFNKVFDGYSNALKELGLPPNSVSHHEDTFLESEFHRFVKENGRTPTYIEFNNSKYPSFWCYQNRFGSWNKAVEHYGYEPNDRNRKYTLEDGEICASSYEFDISNWLKSINIIYERNIKYIDFIDNYKGKMDCDYKINYDGLIWYVEMAGFLSGTNFQKYSDAEKNYYFKLKYKRKLLKRQGVNYIIIEPCDLKTKTFEEIFYFIK